MRGTSLIITLILASLIAMPADAAPMTPTLVLAAPTSLSVPAGGDEIALPLNATYTIEPALQGTVTLDARILAKPAWAIARISPEIVTIEIQPGVRSYSIPFTAFIVASRDAQAHAEAPLSVQVTARETPLYAAMTTTEDVTVRAGYRGDVRGQLSSVTTDAGVTTAEIALENAGNGDARVEFEETGRVPGVKVVVPSVMTLQHGRAEPLILRILAHVEPGSLGGVVKIRASSADASNALTPGNALDFAFEVAAAPVRDEGAPASGGAEPAGSRDTPALPSVGLIASLAIASRVARRHP